MVPVLPVAQRPPWSSGLWSILSTCGDHNEGGGSSEGLSPGTSRSRLLRDLLSFSFLFFRPVSSTVLHHCSALLASRRRALPLCCVF